MKLSQEAQDSYDKTVVWLCGGALAVSLSVLIDIIQNTPVRSLGAFRWATVVWAIGLVAAVLSYYCSAAAMRKVIEQIDRGDRSPEAANGGWYDRAVKWLNPIGGTAFVVGVVLAGMFLFGNL